MAKYLRGVLKQEYPCISNTITFQFVERSLFARELECSALKFRLCSAAWSLQYATNNDFQILSREPLYFLFNQVSSTSRSEHMVYVGLSCDFR